LSKETVEPEIDDPVFVGQIKCFAHEDKNPISFHTFLQSHFQAIELVEEAFTV
jgi:hypothetical protein